MEISKIEPSHTISSSDLRETCNNHQKIVLDIRLHAESIRDEHRTKETRVTPRFEGEIDRKLRTAKKPMTKDIKKSNRMTKHLITGTILII